MIFYTMQVAGIGLIIFTRKNHVWTENDSLIIIIIIIIIIKIRPQPTQIKKGIKTIYEIDKCQSSYGTGQNIERC